MMNASSLAAVLVMAVAVSLGCSGTSPGQRKESARTPATPRRHLPIEQVPMYAGLDRRSVPELKTADDWFIAQNAAKFGTREKAAMTRVDEGFQSYKEGDLDTAMKRFNEGWLLDPKNPWAFWGFGSVLHNREKAFDSYEMMMRAHSLGLRDSGFLADLGRVAVLRIVEQPNLESRQQAQFHAESESFYAQAVGTGTNLVYVYESWAFSRYAQNDYTGAWEKIAEARRNGGVASPQLLEMLSAKMPEPE
jgi:hypothetical protein